MNKWIKENWFKLLIATPIFLGGLSVAYYFSYALPRLNNQHAADEQKVVTLQSQFTSASSTAKTNEITPPNSNASIEIEKCKAHYLNLDTRWTDSAEDSQAITTTATNNYEKILAAIQTQSPGAYIQGGFQGFLDMSTSAYFTRKYTECLNKIESGASTNQ